MLFKTQSFLCLPGIVDFMYYGEVAVPTADISRFLAVAEQFQVRGLVEDVPKVSLRCYSSLLSVHKSDQQCP